MVEQVSRGMFRVVHGRKADGDLRLEWRVGGQWVPVGMAVAFLLVDFFCENEDHLAATPFGAHWRQRGRDYFMSFVGMAAEQGWKPAAERLQEERQRREQIALPQVQGTSVSDGLAGFDEEMARFGW